MHVQRALRSRAPIYCTICVRCWRRPPRCQAKMARTCHADTGPGRLWTESPRRWSWVIDASPFEGTERGGASQIRPGCRSPGGSIHHPGVCGSRAWDKRDVCQTPVPRAAMRRSSLSPPARCPTFGLPPRRFHRGSVTLLPEEMHPRVSRGSPSGHHVPALHAPGKARLKVLRTRPI